MHENSSAGLRIGDWLVRPATGEMYRAPETVRPDARVLRLLLCLAARPGEVVSIDELLNEVWSGVIVTPDSVYQAVTALRRVLGDDPKRPTYIATVPRLGYRMIAPVAPMDACEDVHVVDPVVSEPARAADELASMPPVARRLVPKARNRAVALTGWLVLLIATGCVAYAYRTPASVAGPRVAPTPARNSVAVVPFLDLTTQAMNEEYFADGMTEELIGDLSRIPGLKVPSPTAVFFFKDKALPVAQIAHELGVNFVIDGSVRKAGNTFRVAARMVRADDGFVVWTQSYDQPFGDVLAMQKDIAAQMTQSVHTAIGKATVQIGSN